MNAKQLVKLQAHGEKGGGREGGSGVGREGREGISLFNTHHKMVLLLEKSSHPIYPFKLIVHMASIILIPSCLSNVHVYAVQWLFKVEQFQT